MDNRRMGAIGWLGKEGWSAGSRAFNPILHIQHLAAQKRRSIQGFAAVGLSVTFSLIAAHVEAMPGQSPDEAVVWIRANSTLRPMRGEKLLVRKSDTPAQRFTFWASPQPVGRAAAGATGSIIRTEEISFFDMQNGVSRDRLQESLRIIYGPTVYQDYIQAKTVYAYPTPPKNDTANRHASTVAALQGEVREGDRYAYWLEIARQQNGLPYIGKITVFLRDDLPKLDAELRQR